MKKVFAILVAIVLSLSIVACGETGNEGDNDNNSKIENPYYSKSLNLSEKIFEDFWLPSNRMMAYVPEYISGDIDSDLSGTAALWSYGAVLTMVGTMAKLDPEYSLNRERMSMMLKGLEEFRLPRKARVYSATVGLSEPYYDDNAWVALGMYDFAEVEGEDSECRTIAKDITDYVLSGESVNGGIFWKESVASRNTCSSGPAIVAALKEYKLSEDKKYLEAAERIYDWTHETLCDPLDNVYWDNATYDENTGTEIISKPKFTYNSGTMIWAGTMLYEITGNAEYLEDAKKTAEGSFAYFTMQNSNGVSYFPATPWFNLYLLQGYLSLYNIDGNDEYIEAFAKNLDIAWENGRDENGYVMPNWGVGAVLDEYKYVSLLQEAATAECYALIAGYQIKKGEQQI